MAPRDIACPLIRDMAVHLVRGITPGEIFRHYLGRSGGPMDGRDGNVHIGSFERGTIPMISHLPEMLPVGMGVALSRARRGEAVAALGFCGDGASAGGVFHETLNLAALWRAPLVVIVERNRYAYMTPERTYLAVPEIAARAAGYGIPSWSGDGNDVLEVHALVSERARARALGRRTRARRALHVSHARTRRARRSALRPGGGPRGLGASTTRCAAGAPMPSGSCTGRTRSRRPSMRASRARSRARSRMRSPRRIPSVDGLATSLFAP